MAPTPSTIPTSFVPKQPVRPGTSFTKTGGNMLLIISVVILGIAVLGAGGVFAFERYLMSVRTSKSEAVTEARKKVDSSAIEEFVRMRDRFSNAKVLLDSHIEATGFFDLLEQVTLQSVRFDSLDLIVADDRSAEITMGGTARTFNALAAQSSVLADEKLIKRAIFSDIAVDEENDTVTFRLEADLDPSLLAFTAPETAEAVPVEEMPAPVETVPDTAPEALPSEGAAPATGPITP